MRLILHTLVTLMIAAILGGVSMHHVHAQRDQSRRTQARAELDRFRQQINLQVALASTSQNKTGAPQTVDPHWFEGNLPTNPLLGPDHPWVEIAGPEQKNLTHPKDLAATDQSVAAFWYNPHNGIVRAHVPAGISDTRALAMYNEVNDCSLPSLFTSE